MARTKMAARKHGGNKRKLDVPADAESDRPAKRTPSKPAAQPRQTDLDETIAMMDPALLADHFANSIELEEQYLPTKSFRNTTAFDKPHAGTKLPEFLEQFAENGKAELSACEEEASPHTLIIAPSGIRTADLNRELRVFNTEESKVAKLIAKHMKLHENIDYMRKNKVGIAVGTPTRVKDLIDADAMKTSDIRRIVVDGSYKDEKKRSIFEMEELFRPLLALLNMEQIRKRYGAEEDKVEILVF
ncbi:Protein cms1 [Exophiala xenobiotica]|nr:Protein cms1 [Exophiala xenobiotica]KAK5244555.1 Protein cms1 [Exophiala xenobiotica]KAK5363664.1 Protein cms1 [Exophiala xenobiotica]KAK5365029.1 Protein cms1 [Exophiala xenobiotica]